MSGEEINKQQTTILTDGALSIHSSKRIFFFL